MAGLFIDDVAIESNKDDSLTGPRKTMVPLETPILDDNNRNGSDDHGLVRAYASWSFMEM